MSIGLQASKPLALLGVAVLIALGLFLLWPASQVFLVLFAAVLFAVFINTLVALIPARLAIPLTLARIAVTVLLLGLLSLFFVLAGPGIGDQLGQLSERLPRSMARLREVFQLHIDWQQLKNNLQLMDLQPDASQIMAGVTGVFSTTMGALTNLAAALLIGFYLALRPQVYLRGVLHLFPQTQRERIGHLFQALYRALGWWMLGRFSAMVAVGLLTTVALQLIGMPLALALGVIAGLLSFVPVLGPIAAAVPAILVALLESPLMAGYVVLIYSGVQFIEGNLLTPLIQERTVALPPAVLLAMQFAMAIFYGLFGVLLATPLAVSAIVMVQMLYVRGVLNDSIQLLGEHRKA